MGQHAKRFDSVGAQKGSGLRLVVDQLKSIADTAEEWFDPNSPEVVNAMQHFERGLGALSTAPANPSEEEKPKASRSRKSATPKSEKPEENASDA